MLVRGNTRGNKHQRHYRLSINIKGSTRVIRNRSSSDILGIR